MATSIGSFIAQEDRCGFAHGSNIDAGSLRRSMQTLYQSLNPDSRNSRLADALKDLHLLA
jgi:hypothetical protein